MLPPLIGSRMNSSAVVPEVDERRYRRPDELDGALRDGLHGGDLTLMRR